MKHHAYAVFACALLSTRLQGAPITLQNASFATSGSGAGEPTHWTTVESGSNPIYTQNNDSSSAGENVGSVLHFKDGTPTGNSIQQSFPVGEATVDTAGSYTIGFDLGWRNDDEGSAAMLKVSLINVTDGGAELAATTITLAPRSPRLLDSYSKESTQSLNLNYDHTAPGLTGDTIALKIERFDALDTSGGTYHSTIWIDNVTVETDIDTDGDGLPDSWELAHSLDPNDDGSTNVSNGASGDPDIDGSNNLAEFQQQTDPQDNDSDDDGLLDGYEVNTSMTNPNDALDPGSDADSDGDGLPNDWEILHDLDLVDDGSTNPNNGANGDPDGDGLPNDEEYFLGSDPQINETGKPYVPRPSQVRLMVIGAHPDDEGIFFGGVIPYYTQVKQIPTVFVCMTSGDWTLQPETREAEMRNAAWEYGLRNQPIFPRFRDVSSSTHSEINIMWDFWADGVNDGGTPAQVQAGKDKATITLATYIRRYRPEVIATHSDRGEYGHTNHRATSMATQWAITMAADNTIDLDGLPAWQVFKLYTHMQGGSGGAPDPNPGAKKLFHDFWQDISIDTTGNGSADKTPIQVANNGLNFHATQGSPNVSTCYANNETSFGWEPHACEWWELEMTTVGDDTIQPNFVAPNANNSNITYSGWAKGDFFENLVTYPDSDADKLPDSWELAHFPSLSAADANSDHDNDGINNYDEFVAGLNPGLPDQVALEAGETQITFTVPAASGPGYAGLNRRYRLLKSTNLTDWSAVVMEGIADGTSITHNIIGNNIRTFYRLEFTIE